MIFEHATLTIGQENREGFLHAYPDIRAHLLTAQECRSVDLHPSVDRDDVYLLRVAWDWLEDHTEVFPESDSGRAVLAGLQNYVQSVDVVHFSGSPV